VKANSRKNQVIFQNQVVFQAYVMSCDPGVKNESAIVKASARAHLMLVEFQAFCAATDDVFSDVMIDVRAALNPDGSWSALSYDYLDLPVPSDKIMVLLQSGKKSTMADVKKADEEFFLSLQSRFSRAMFTICLFESLKSDKDKLNIFFAAPRLMAGCLASVLHETPILSHGQIMKYGLVFYPEGQMMLDFAEFLKTP
jgi:hypothetical protein